MYDMSRSTPTSYTDDVRMVEARHALRLEQEAAADLIRTFGENFDGDVALEDVIGATVDIGHAAAADLSMMR